MNIFKKLVLAGLLLVFTGLPLGVLAADPPPALNPMCWKQKECSQIRKQLGADKPEEGWVKDNAPCTGGEGDNAWGMCLPPLKTVTEISFGGSNTFTNIGEFILYVYKYAVGIAAVLATVMIIIAGTQWATSGGNTETINNARKRITGAVIGLFIALMSNFILNSINPALVNLRLPQVWMVKKQGLVSEYCNENPDKTVKYAQAADSSPAEQAKTVSPTGKEQFTYNPWNEGQKRAFWCGKRFFMEGGGAGTCWGDFCDPKQMCYKNSQNVYGCIAGFLAGKIDAGFKLDKTHANVVQNIEVYAICKNSTELKLAGNTLTLAPDGSSFVVAGDPQDPCGGKDNTIGYFIGMLVTDCSIGGEGICLTTVGSQPDWYAVGRSPGSNSCNVNLALQEDSVLGITSDCSKTPRLCACYAVGLPDSLKYFSDPSFSPAFTSYLITYDEIQKGFRCNISVDRDVFPGLDNNVASASVLKSLFGVIPSGLNFAADKIIGGAVTTRCDGKTM